MTYNTIIDGRWLGNGSSSGGMSIDDILKDDTFLPTLVIVIIILGIIFVPIALSLSAKQRNAIYGDNETGAIEKEKVRIVSKKTTSYNGNQAIQVNIVVFEKEDKSRIDLAIKDFNVFNVMIEEDVGLLTHKGKQFIDFQLDIPTEKTDEI